MPRQSERLCSGNTNADASKTTRPNIDHDQVRLALVRQGGNERQQAFSVAASNDLMLCGNETVIVE
jgi:hypothetical protein